MSRRALSVLNVCAFVGVVVLNGLAASGALSGRSIGELANRDPTYVLPADYVFGIWSVIYAALLGFVIYQALPRPAAGALVERVGWLWIINAGLNAAWLTAFSFERFALALLLMLALLVDLILLYGRVHQGGLRVQRGDWWFATLPFGIYLAWIAVATIANTSQLLEVVGWDGFGVAGPVWSVLLMAVAAGLAATFAVRRRDVTFGLVVGWALIGIAARWPEARMVATTAWALGLLSVGMALVGARPGVASRTA
ncbi:MAG: tryptophan-rich sensory protein [Gemmatimonadota bacterium]|nr:tryptophan-rich sensory protein [Gemmatimonadota bacterium]